jgi:hypothetical protein
MKEIHYGLVVVAMPYTWGRGEGVQYWYIIPLKEG